MRCVVDGDDLCIRIPLNAAATCAVVAALAGGVRVTVRDNAALGLAIGRELVDCETVAEEPFLNGVLDSALRRVIEKADPSLNFAD